MAVATLWAGPAMAQDPAGPMPSGPIINSWYLGANTGAAVVENFSGVGALEGGVRFWRNLDLIGEIVWVGDAASRRELDKVGKLAESLGAMQGGSAAGDIRVPTTYGGLGGRWVLEQGGRFRPYFLGTIGGAKINRKAKLTLDGTDVTGSAAQYGITLGQDVIGKYNNFASEGGIGVVMGIGTWYIDLGARLLSVNTDEARVNIARIVIGGGYRF
jgi:hypothetical protein